MKIKRLPAWGCLILSMVSACATKGRPVPNSLSLQSSPPAYEVDLSRLPQVYFSLHPEWEALYRAAWECHRNNIRPISPALNPERSGGGKQGYYVDEAFDNRIFQWDTLFMMLFDKYGLPQFPTLNSMDNFYYHQWDSPLPCNGFISRMIYESNGRDFYSDASVVDAINPPLFAWAEWEQYQVHGDCSRFRQRVKGKPIIDRIAELFFFIKKNRRLQTGPMKGCYVSNGQGNGLDNTPNQDAAGWGQAANDITLQQAQAAEGIARICRTLTERDRALTPAETEHYLRLADQFSAEADELKQLIREKLWFPEDGFFCNAYADSGQSTHIITPTGLWALIAGVATPEQAEIMIQRHALNSEKLFRPNGLASLAYDHPAFKPSGGYWNGAVWAPTSYQWLKGLQRYGYDDLAFQEAVRHVEALSDLYAAGGVDRRRKLLHTLWENISSEYRMPGSTEFNDREPARADFVGWTGALAIGSLIEDLLGIRLQAPDNTLYWNLRLTEAHGIRHLFMHSPQTGDNFISLSAAARPNATAPASLTVTAEQPFTLVVTVHRQTERLSVAPGSHTFCVGAPALSPARPSLSCTVLPLSETSFPPDCLQQALDFLYFATDRTGNRSDGLPHQIQKSNLIYNVNTVGCRHDGPIGKTELIPCPEWEALGIKGAGAYRRRSQRYGAEGFMMMVPASLQRRSLWAAVGVQQARVTVEAALSDASAPRIRHTLQGGKSEKTFIIQIPFRAASDGQSMRLYYRFPQEAPHQPGSLSLKGIFLFDEPETPNNENENESQKTDADLGAGGRHQQAGHIVGHHGSNVAAERKNFPNNRGT